MEGSVEQNRESINSPKQVAQVVSDRGAKVDRGETFFLANVLEQLNIQRLKNAPGPKPYTLDKMNSKWTIGLTAKFNSIKILEYNTRKSLGPNSW